MHDQQILPDATNRKTHLQVRIGNVRGEERPRKRPPSAPEIPRYQGPATGDTAPALARAISTVTKQKNNSDSDSPSLIAFPGARTLKKFPGGLGEATENYYSENTVSLAKFLVYQFTVSVRNTERLGNAFVQFRLRNKSHRLGFLFSV